MFGPRHHSSPGAPSAASSPLTGSTTRASTLGISRATRYDYFLRLGCAPLTVLMNKDSFARLPPRGQDAIRKFSGEWFAANYANHVTAHNEVLLARMRADPTRTVTDPPQAEIDAAEAAFKPIVERWLAPNLNYDPDAS